MMTLEQLIRKNYATPDAGILMDGGNVTIKNLEQKCALLRLGCHKKHDFRFMLWVDASRE